MKIGVRVMPRAEVLDTQGRAVEQTLKIAGMQVTSCKIGRYIVLELLAKNSAEAMAQAKAIAEFVLCNPLIETFELEAI